MTRPLLLIVVALALLRPVAAAAHGVSVFAWAEEGTIRGEGTFSGGRKVKSGTVTVLALAEERQLATAPIGADGLFEFDIGALGLAEPVDLLIVLDAGPGHRGQWRVRAADYTMAGAGPGSAAAGVEQSQRPPSGPPLGKAVIGVACLLGLGALLALARKKGGKS